MADTCSGRGTVNRESQLSLMFYIHIPEFPAQYFHKKGQITFLSRKRFCGFSSETPLA